MSEETVYHYTDAHGFKAIIENKKLWFSDCFKQNDSQEWNYAVDRLKNEMQESEDFSDEDIERLEAIVESIVETSRPFLCCFSKSADQLGQWRSYSDDGRGYAIGFSKESLNYFSDFRSEVDYEGKKSQDILDIMKIIIVTLPHVESHEDEEIKSSVALLKGKLEKLIRSLIFSKNPAFREEQEFRLLRWVHIKDDQFLDSVSFSKVLLDSLTSANEESTLIKKAKEKFDGQDKELKEYGQFNGFDFELAAVKFRTNYKGALIPFLELSFANFPIPAITEIWIGPKNTNDEATLRQFLRAQNLSDVKVHRSKASYR